MAQPEATLKQRCLPANHYVSTQLNPLSLCMPTCTLQMSCDCTCSERITAGTQVQRTCLCSCLVLIHASGSAFS